MKKKTGKNSKTARRSRLVKKWDGTPVDSARSMTGAQKKPSMRTLRTRLANDPDDTDARLLLADALLSRKKPGEAIALLESPEASRNMGHDREDDLRAQRTLAFAYAKVGRFEDAARVAGEALADDDRLLDFHYLLAYSGSQQAEPEQTVTHARRYLSLLDQTPGDAIADGFRKTAAQRHEVCNYLGSALEKQGAFDDAMAAYEQAIEARRSYETAWLNLIRLLNHVGRDEDAALVINEAGKACPRSKSFKANRSKKHAKTRTGRSAGAPTIALCMIVKNEEEHLPNCLQSVKSFVDEIIVVDTGSSDRTVEIAESFGATVYHHEWEGNFSKARNISMGYGTSDWILILDADEEIQEGDGKVIREVLAETRFKALAFSVYNYSAQKKMYTSFLPSIRLFRRDLGAYYEGIVHNQLRFPTLEGVLRVPVRINHYGYGLSPEIMARKIARTKGLLQKQLDENPNNGFAHFNMAQLIRGEEGTPTPESMEQVVFHAGKAVDLSSPDNPQERHIHLMALHQLVTAYFNIGDYERAAQAAHRALAHKPGYLDAILSLGHIHSMDGRHDLARKYYLEYLDRQKAYDEHAEVDHVILLHLRSRHNALYGLGLVAEMQNDPQEAIQWYERCIEERPDYIDVHHRLGMMYLRCGRRDDACTEFQTELSLHADNLDARLQLAELQLEMGDSAAAADTFEGGRETDPNSPRLLIPYAQLAFTNSQYKKVVSLLTPIADSDPQWPNACKLKADAFYELQEYADATGCYEEYLKTHPDDCDVLNNLGNCCFRIGDYENAEGTYKRLIDQGSAGHHVYRNLGLVLARQGKTDDAIFALESYSQLDPDDVEAIGYLGDLHFERQDYTRAIAEYEKVLEQQPGRPDTLTRLGDCYLNQGALAAALLGYERALAADPDYNPAWDRVREVRAFLVERIKDDAATENPEEPAEPVGSIETN